MTSNTSLLPSSSSSSSFSCAGTDRPATPDPLLTLHAAVPARQARCLRNPLQVGCCGTVQCHPDQEHALCVRHIVLTLLHPPPPRPPVSWLLLPLQAPAATLQASHTSISLPLGSVDLFGNYSVLGPAVIKKINNVLVALVQPGGSVSVLNSSSAGPTVMSCASLSHDEDASAVVNLSGQHLELDGSYELYDTDSDRTIQHDGKVIVSPATLSEDSCILLLPNGTLSHPVNVHPHDGHST